ncbi:MAG: MgtC/SapB family protein [Clostridia bacterium]|nr:MgtC/SapB family protein [Clostridia bacterium]
MVNGLLPLLDPLRGSNAWAVAFKLLLAVLFGGLIGLERRRKRRPAGFRTHILVCVGVTLAFCTNIFLFDLFAKLFPAGYDKLDISRLGAQVINGIGFLGAGTIIITGRHQVVGLTTAAGLWASACMGLAIGAGYFECAAIAFVFIYLTITGFNNVEKKFTERSKNMNIYIIVQTPDDIKEVTDRLESLKITVYDVEITNIRELASQPPALVIESGLPERSPHSDVIMALAAIDGVISVEEV